MAFVDEPFADGSGYFDRDMQENRQSDKDENQPAPS
jgi:hypothetical protein